jgi:hypothetical protein
MADTFEVGTGRDLEPVTDGEMNLTRRTRSQILNQSSRLSYPEIQSEQALGRIRFAIHEAQPLSLNIEQTIKAPIFDNVTSWFGKTTGSDEAKTDDDIKVLTRDTQDPRPEGDAARARLSAAAVTKKEIDDTEKSLAEESAKLAKGVSYKLSRSEPIVDMYLPVSMVYNDAMAYDTPNLGMIGGATLSGMSAGAGAFASAYEGMMQGLGSIFGYLGGAIKGQDALALGALRAAKLVPSSGFQAAVSLGVQTSLNPNTRSLFKSVNLREFAFTFKMIPNSPSEAKAVEKIVRHFRRNAYPELIDVKGVPVAYKFPHAFSIQFTHRGIESKLPRLERCYLRNVQSTYNATGAAYHSDGQPNEVDLTLNFVEIRTLSKKDIEEGL